MLAGVSVTNVNSTDVTGDLGVSPGATVFGFPPGTVSGTKHQGDATAAAAKTDALAAYNDIAGRAPDATLGTQLGGTTRGPGVYDSASGDFTISGTLTLDAQGDPDAVFIFRSTLLNAANVSNISLLRGAQADNVFWRVTDTATLGSYCTFRGNILAGNFVTVNSGVNLNGRAFALGDTVTLQGTTTLPHTRITVPNDPPTTTTLTSSLNPAWKGDAVTLTATVNAVSGPVVPAARWSSRTARPSSARPGTAARVPPRSRSPTSPRGCTRSSPSI
ncbi:ice-binding family protein [Streptosporangium lutulentum]